MFHLIITADDYGLHPTVNAAVAECLAAGTVRSTCVMANMPDSSAVSALRRAFPSASIGIHWTLTLGKPVLPHSEVKSLVNYDGEFYTFTEFRRRWVRRQIRVAEVQKELTAQYERFLSFAGQPDYWNTHQNIHVFPVLFQTFVAKGFELGIPAMRSHRRITVPIHSTPARYNLSHPLYWLKGKVIDRWCAQAKARGVLMPDGLVDMPGYDKGAGDVERAIERIPWHSVRQAVEVTIHPATSVQRELFGRLTESRVKEYQIFKDPGMVHRLRQLGVETVGFEVLSHDS